MTVTYKVVRHKQVGNHYVVRAENVDPATEEVIRELSPTENPLKLSRQPVAKSPRVWSALPLVALIPKKEEK